MFYCTMKHRESMSNSTKTIGPVCKFVVYFVNKWKKRKGPCLFVTTDTIRVTRGKLFTAVLLIFSFWHTSNGSPTRVASCQFTKCDRIIDSWIIPGSGETPNVFDVPRENAVKFSYSTMEHFFRKFEKNSEKMQLQSCVCDTSLVVAINKRNF